jgi:hypothetical protein
MGALKLIGAIKDVTSAFFLWNLQHKSKKKFDIMKKNYVVVSHV